MSPHQVEWFGGEELHGAGDAALVLVGGVAFLDADAVEQLGGEQAEIEATAATDVAAIVHTGGGVAEHFHAVELRAREIGAEAAQGDLASFAGVARDGDTRHACSGRSNGSPLIRSVASASAMGPEYDGITQPRRLGAKTKGRYRSTIAGEGRATR